MEAAFRDSVQEERERGRTVLLSSHILSEVEALCDRVTIIRAGATVETGTLTRLRHLTRTSITAELATRPDLDQLAGLHAVTIEPGPEQVTELHCEVDTGQLDELLRRLVAAGVRNLVSRPARTLRGAVPPALRRRRRPLEAAGAAVIASAARPGRADRARPDAGRLAGVGELTRLALRRDRSCCGLGLRAGRLAGRGRLQPARALSRRPPGATPWWPASRATRRCRFCTGTSRQFAGRADGVAVRLQHAGRRADGASSWSSGTPAPTSRPAASSWSGRPRSAVARP